MRALLDSTGKESLFKWREAKWPQGQHLSLHQSQVPDPAALPIHLRPATCLPDLIAIYNWELEIERYM